MSNDKAKILVVDDDPMVRMLASEILQEGGFAVTETDNGENALQQIIAEGCDLILLDVIMPELDGFATCERLRRMPGGVHLPVVMMTGLDDRASIERAYDAGATDFISKPINWPVLAHRVRYILRASAALREAAWHAEFQRVLIETIPAPILVEDAQNRLLVCNPALTTLLGTPCADVLNETECGVAAKKRILPEPPDTVACDPLGRQVYEAELARADGEQRSVMIHRAAFIPPGATETGVISAILDITERKRHEEQLRLAQTVFQTAADAIMVTDALGKIQSVNPAFTTITGYLAEEVIGQTPRLLNADRHDEPFYIGFWRTLTETGRWSGEIWQRRKSSENYPAWQSIEAVRGSDSDIVQYVAFFSDITQRKLAEQEIFFRAHYDPLTGLPNRSLLHERINQALKQACRHHRRVALMFLDLDRFKQVNDTLGHAWGDLLLCQTAERLKASMRETDTVARYSGDEFVLVLPEVVDDQDVSEIARKVIAKIAEPFDLSGNTIRIGVSIGIVLYPDHGLDAATLLRHADLAMYQAKTAGRNTYRQYEAIMSDHALRQLSLETDLRLALERDELTVYYQAIIDVKSGHLAGAEALVRWRHPQRGLVPPNDFIPLAEETGLIQEVGAWVLERVCQTIKAWQQRGLRIPISVNLSGIQIVHGLSVETVYALLQRYELRPEWLAFEITESVLMNDTLHAQQWLESIRKLGIRLDMDDFGTGYSSLAYLKRFPIDRIKIDRSFVRDIVADANDRALVEAMLAMAHSLHINVVAEGVEDEEQRSLLHRLGCEYAQGFHFSRPVPDEDFVKFAKELGAIHG